MNHHEQSQPERTESRHPNAAFTTEELQRRMVAAALEQVADADTVPIRDESHDAAPIAVTRRDYTDEERAQLHGSDVRARAATRSTDWINKDR